MKKITLIALLSILLTSCSVNVEPTISTEELNSTVNTVHNSKLLLVDIYHDHCRTCQLIDPTVDKLKIKYAENKNISIIKYDLSTPLTTANSFAVADALGLADIYRAQRYSGLVLFINSKTNEILESIIGESSIEVYDQAIERNLKLI